MPYRGLAEVLCRFCSRHTGVGLSREDVVRQGLPLPVDDYLAGTVEERLVMYADKFHSKTSPPRFVTAGDGRAAHLDVAIAAGQRHLVPAALS